MPRYSPELRLTLRLPPSGAAPLRHRIAEAIVGEIRSGTLGDGDLLPSSRMLATELGVSRSSVIGAYDELAAAGFATGRAGSGTRVAAGAAAAAMTHPRRVSGPGSAAPPVRAAGSIRWDLAPGHPDTGLIAVRDWRRSWRAAAAAEIDPGSAGADAHPRLRAALATHLRRSRGIAADPDDVVIFASVAAALRTLVQARLRRTTVAFEDPGFFRAGAAIESAGALLRAIAVDEDGLDPGSLTSSDSAVYCTPAHQYPLGGRMPVARRAQLLAWAHETGGLIVEDDYDSEYRYDVSSLPPLRALRDARDHVAHIGTASKMLTPSLRLAWLVCPPGLRDDLDRVQRSTNENAAAVGSDAFAHFLDSGAMARHLARSARTYRARRHAFVDALTRELHGLDARVMGVDAGLHAVLRVPDHIDDAALARDLARDGVLAPSLDAYRHAVRVPRGLVCGYARLPETQAGTAAAVIARVLAGYPSGGR